jgi:hypothetical protein
MRRDGLFRQPLFRLLAVNLAAGVSLAVLLVGGLLYLNPGHLRDLIFSDNAPLTALGLLAFGFTITFGSVAMGSAIMAMGSDLRGNGGGRRERIDLIPNAVPVPVHVVRSNAGAMRRRDERY